jgi:VanZ family protein
MPKLTPLTVFGIRLATLILIIYWIALFTGTHMPSPPKVRVPYGDKLQHFSAFFGLAMLLCWAIPNRGKLLRKIAIVLAIAIPYAAFDEWSQRFTRARTVDIYDFYTNAAGILTATACYALVRAVYISRQRPSADVTAYRADATRPKPLASPPQHPQRV